MNPTRPSLPLLLHRMALAALLGGVPLRSQPRRKAAPPPPGAACLPIVWKPAEGRGARPGSPVLEPGALPGLEDPRASLRLVPVAAQAAPAVPSPAGTGLGSGCRF